MDRQYETAFILNPALDDAEIDQKLAQIEQTVAQEGATVGEWNRIGKRKLSYPIRKQHDGYYAFLTFTAEPPVIEALGKIYRLDEKIIRHMTINTEED
jgi:small subunit ribosomal protein S6